MKYRLIIFDLAGTTVTDTNTVGACLQAALLEIGVEASVDEVNEVMGMPKPDAISLLLTRHGSNAEVEPIFQSFRNLMISTYKTSEDVTEIDGATEVFTELRQRGMKIATDTGFDREITNILFNRLGWGDLIDDSITSDEVANGRPHPDMALELARRQGFELHETIKVGDTPADILEGKNAGVGLNIGVTYGTHTHAQLEPLGADMLISDIRELLKLEL